MLPEDPKARKGKGFRLVSEDEETAAPPETQPSMAGVPPKEPPVAPPMASEPEPTPEPAKGVEAKVKQLEQENEQLICVVYWLQQELKELRSSK